MLETWDAKVVFADYLQLLKLDSESRMLSYFSSKCEMLLFQQPLAKGQMEHPSILTAHFVPALPGDFALREEHTEVRQ